MRLLFIRHAEPDYEHDTLTLKGIREAETLSEYISDLNIDEIYKSPLGRASKTAEYSLKKLGMTAKTCDWLREFPAVFDPNLSADAAMAYKTELSKDPESGLYNKHIIWDILPSYYGLHPELFERNSWRNSDIATNGNMNEQYDYVEKSFLKLLSEHGYEKEGDTFKVTESNDKTIAFFCHFGITSVLLSILWNISPFVPLQYMATAPTSVTELVTEEREKGIAIFRALRIGDITHLNMAKEKPSFSARFCEKYDNIKERH